MKDDPRHEDDSMSTTTTSQLLQPTRTTSLRRRNSLVFPTPLRTLSLPPLKDVCLGLVLPNGDAATAAAPLPSQPPSFDAGLAPTEVTSSLCYTSLRDLISSASSSAAMSSPASATLAMSSCYQIPIRNRLVKQAAWAYLQPMSSSSFVSSSRPQLFFARLWDRVSSWRPLECLKEHVEGCFLPAMQKILTRIRQVVRWLIAR